MPKVSIIIPTQRRHALLVEAVESILRQTFQDFEVIVVGSGAGTTTATMAASRRLTAADARIRFVCGTEDGISKARNIGTDLAQGEWIAFLDDDDLWLPQKLELQLAAAQATGADLIATQYIGFDSTGDLSGSGSIPKPAQWTWAEACYVGCPRMLLTSTVLVRRSVLRGLGGFDECLRFGEDEDLWWRIAARHSVHFIDSILVRYRLHAGNGSGLARPLGHKVRHLLKRCLHCPPGLLHMLPRMVITFLVHTFLAPLYIRLNGASADRLRTIVRAIVPRDSKPI
jgi:glycosyltransferase involved in cell wall biosynthesis